MRQCFCRAPLLNHSINCQSTLAGWQRDLNPHQHPQAKANCSMDYSTGGTLSLLCRLNYTLHGIINIGKEKTRKKYRFVVQYPKYSSVQQIISKEHVIQNTRLLILLRVTLSSELQSHALSPANVLLYSKWNTFNPRDSEHIPICPIQSILLQYHAILDIYNQDFFKNQVQIFSESRS